MNDLITAYVIVCYKVNAVHYLKQSQGTRMVNLNHALRKTPPPPPPPHFSRAPSNSALRAQLFFLGEERRGSAAVVLERPTDCRDCERAWAEMMIPLRGPQRQPGATKMERGHQKHL